MAGIIKAGTLHKGANVARHVEFNFDDMSDRAGEYLSSVKQRAAQIISEAKQRAGSVKTQAQQQGLQAAQQAACQAAEAAVEAKWQRLLPALQQAITALQQLKSAWMQEWERNAVQLAVAIAERIVRRQLEQVPEISQQWIREALELAAGSQRVRLLVNPDDYETLSERHAQIVREFENLAPTDIVPHPEITSGGCRVVTEYGQIDQQLETQLARIQEEIAP